MKTRISAAVVCSALTAWGIVHAESTPREALLVLSKGDRTLAIVDPGSLKVVTRLPSGPDPHEVIASSDGKSAYISNYGGGAYHTLSVVDLVAQKALPIVELGALRGPHGLTFVDGKVWFTAEGAKAMGRYDPASKNIDWILGTGQNRTHMIYVFPDLKRVVTSNVASGTMTIAEKVQMSGPPGAPPHEDWNETVIPVGKGSEGFDVSRDGKEIWVANAGDGTISIIDIANKKVVQTLAANVVSANRLKFTPDGARVFVSSLRLPEVAVFDAGTRAEVKRVKVGHGAAGIEMQPDGSRVFVSCTPDDYVAVIDLKSLEVTGHIEAGKGPDGLAWAVQK
jgi:YVTN family beta-propeller protein